MGVTRSDGMCLDIESPFERPNKNRVLKNPPPPPDDPIYSRFEFHITQLHLLLTKFCLLYFLVDNISCSPVIFNRAVFQALGLLRSNCENSYVDNGS